MNEIKNLNCLFCANKEKNNNTKNIKIIGARKINSGSLWLKSIKKFLKEVKIEKNKSLLIINVSLWIGKAKIELYNKCKLDKIVSSSYYYYYYFIKYFWEKKMSETEINATAIKENKKKYFI